jgi:alpha-2-macroglobulin
MSISSIQPISAFLRLSGAVFLSLVGTAHSAASMATDAAGSPTAVVLAPAVAAPSEAALVASADAAPAASAALADPAPADRRIHTEGNQDEKLKSLAGLAEVPENLRRALLAGEHKTALRLIDKLVQNDPQHSDFWRYLKAHALQGAERSTEAIEVLAKLETDIEARISDAIGPGTEPNAGSDSGLNAERNAEGNWYRKARFFRADLLRSQRLYADAEQIYEVEAQRLRSAERQAELAAVYLNFAKQFSTPPEPSNPDQSGVDYARAYTLYSKVLELGAPASAHRIARFGMARAQEELNKWDVARLQYQSYLAQFGRPEQAGFAGMQTLEAYYRLARVLYHGGKPNEARHSFEDFLAIVEALHASGKVASQGADSADWSGLWQSWSTADQQSLSNFEGKARFAIALSYQGADSQSRALKIAAFQRFVEAMPAHDLVGAARMGIAETYRDANQNEAALDAFEDLQQWIWPTEIAQDIRESNQRLRQNALFQKAQMLDRLQRFPLAISAYQEYVGRFSTGADWAAAQQGMIDSDYAIGQAHRKAGEWKAAREAWVEFLAAHPLDARAREIAFDLGMMYATQGNELRTAIHQGLAKDAEQEPDQLFKAAISEWGRVARKYPNTNEASKALYLSGWYLENRLLDLENAIEKYSQCSFGSHAQQARQRMREMIKPSLTILTERSWRTDESAKVQVQVRNTSKLTVRLYELDLQAYFRKHLTHRSIEDLDLDLIPADQEYEIEVENYADFKPIQMDVELPVKGAGVWAVAIDDGKRRATTLVVRSDIDVIIKSSRKEVFVYAQDMRKNVPAANVKVLLALPDATPDGLALHELKTGRDGVARLRHKDLANANNLRILATRDGHYASDGLTLNRVRMSSGLRSRGYLYTDRTAYRPGQLIHWRAILRNVKDGAYHFEPGTEYSAEIVDPRGWVISQRLIQLSEFGTLNEEFLLDPKAVTGKYTVRCSSPGKNSIQGNFEVASFEMRAIELAVDFEQAVYYRGDIVRGTVSAAFYYGEPVADSPLQLTMPDGRVLALRTDSEGKASFEVFTRSLPAVGALAVSARLTEEDVYAAGVVQLSDLGFRANISVPHSVVLAGNSFLAKIATTDAAGDPVARDLHLQVFHRTQSERGSWIDREVSSFDLATDEQGRATQALTLQKGGKYRLLVEGTDRFGHPILSETNLWISGADDSQRVRIMAEQMSIAVGDDLEVDLHNRAGSGLALLTFEGERVLEYQIVKLKEGSNPFRAAMKHAHYPNFRLSLSMMRGNQFHQANADFEVERQLNVTLKPLNKTVAPGEKAVVELEVRDQLGNPVQAELSLAVVDESIFAQFPNGMTSIGQYFEADARRVIGFATTSTCQFNYQGATALIAAAILEEQARAEADKAWAEDRDALLEHLEKTGYFRGPGDVVPPGLAAPASPAAKRLQARVEEMEEEGLFNETIGLGGGAGGRFGGRRGASGSASRSKGLWGQSATSLGVQFDYVNQDQQRLWANAGLAFWAPAVVSDSAGKATVEFIMPQRNSRWRLTCIGASKDTLLGQQVVDMVSRADFFAELRLPTAYTEGDQPEFLIRVHNMTGSSGEAEVQLRLSSEDWQAVLPATLNFEGDEIAEASLHLGADMAAGLPASERLQIEILARANFADGAHRFQSAASVPVQPWGTEFQDQASGVLTSDTTFTLQLPAGMDFRDRSLEIMFGSHLRDLVIDAALQRDGFARPSRHSMPQTQADSASMLIGIAATMQMVETLADANQLDSYQRLRRQAEGLLANLISLQSKDGSWSWSGKANQAQVETSARAMVALGKAQQLGLAIPPQATERGLNFLRQAFRACNEQQNERKAVLLHAMAVHKHNDFTGANRLHRLRASLSPAALAYTSLALSEMGRLPMAAELAQALAGKLNAAKGCSIEGNMAWSRSQIEMTALASLALQQSKVQSPASQAAVDFLLAHRPWGSRRARGLAVAAVAQWLGTTERNNDNADITVEINGEALVMELDAKLGFTGLQEMGFDSDEAIISLSVRGRGQPYFQVRLAGFTRQVEERKSDDFSIARFMYQTEAPNYRGTQITTGFSSLRKNRVLWRNQVSELERGGMIRASLDFYAKYDSNESQEQVNYLTLRVPIPAGTSVVADSVRGNLQHFEIGRQEILVQIGQHRGTGHLNFTLVGSLPGDYRALPARLENAHEPQAFALSKPMNLTILGRGQESSDEYRATPDELYNLGLVMLSKGEDQAAYQSLSTLYREFGDQLRDPIMATIAGKLLFLAIDRNEAQEIVRYFEVLKEKNPSLNIPFEKVLAVGQAYRHLHEFERALLIFRATIEETFGKDLQVAGTLEEMSETMGSMAVLERLYLEFPDMPVVIETYLALSDQLLALAPRAHQIPALADHGWTRARLTLAGINLLKRHLSLYPNDPLASEAGLNLVSAFLDLKDYQESALLAKELSQRFTEPALADTFRYTEAVALWYLGEESQAVKILEGIARASYKQVDGTMRHSENRDLARYILAQIHHARRDFEGAEVYYKQVESVFADAREVLQDFRAKSIELDEITTSAPGKKVELELRHRNVEEAELLVYAVDLMTLYLRERNLSEITSVNLAGIAPTLKRTVKLTTKKGMLEHDTKVSLDLRKPGAYLVICRGDELHTSGLVLVSDIELEVKEDSQASRLRIQARNRNNQKFVREVDVRVVGSSGGDFVSGHTDPRGMFIASGVNGTATVIARYEGNHYAFHRGERYLGAPEEDNRAKDGANRPAQQMESSDYFGNVNSQNSVNVMGRQQRLKEQISRDRKGVQVGQTR